MTAFIKIKKRSSLIVLVSILCYLAHISLSLGLHTSMSRWRPRGLFPERGRSPNDLTAPE